MKLARTTSIACLFLFIGTSVGFAISSNGVDLIRGAWGGPIECEEDDYQLNLYFNEFGPDPLNPGNASVAVASGGISISVPGKNKRAKADIGPMMARYEETGEGVFNVTIYGTVVVDEEAFVIKLNGEIKTFGSSVADDVAEGTWETEFGEGDWSCLHLDRRRVKIPAITTDTGSDLYFDVDVYSTRLDDNGGTSFGTILEVHTNVVAANVRVDIPGNGSIILNYYTDIFSPTVDFVSSFRFLSDTPGRPVEGSPYLFTALDIAGQYIEDVESSDTYIGDYELNPPTNVNLTVVGGEVQITWDDALASYPGAFNQIEVYQSGIGMVYGENLIFSDNSTIPDGTLGAGSYQLVVRSLSVAPEGSSGRGLECNSLDARETKDFILP